MTACVNETKKTVGGGVLQSKVLRAVMALVLAIGLMPVGSAWADPTGGIGINVSSSNVKAVLDEADADWESYNGSETNLIKVYLETSDSSAPAAGLTTQVQAYVENDQLSEQGEKIAVSELVTVSSDDFDGKSATVYIAVPEGYAGTYSVKVGESWIDATDKVAKAAVSGTAIKELSETTPYTGEAIDLKDFYQVTGFVGKDVEIADSLWTVNPATVKDAGIYVPTVSLTDEAFVNYGFGGNNMGKDAKGPFEFTVTKANPAISWNADNGVNGAVSADGQTLTVGYFGGAVDVKASDVVVTGVDEYKFAADTDYTIEVSNGTEGVLTNGAAVEAGDYTVTVKFNDTQATRNHEVAADQALTLVVERAENMSKNQAFAAGEATQARDNANLDITSQLAGGVEWTYDGKAHGVFVEKVLPKGESQAVDVTDTTKYEQKTYKVAADGTRTPEAAPTDAGDYVVVVTPVDGEYKGALSFELEFSIEPRDVAGAVAFDYNDGQEYSVDDDEFTWNAKAQNVGIALDGKVLNKGVDYDVKLYDSNRNTIEDIIAPGQYYVGIAGKGNYAGTKTIALTVDKLDIAEAGLVVNDISNIEENNANKYIQFAADSVLESKEQRDAFLKEVTATLSEAMVAHGQYTLAVNPKASVLGDDGLPREAYVTGTWSSTFNFVEKVVPAANFEYDGVDFATYFENRVYNADSRNGFDPEKVTVWEDKAKNLSYEQGKDYDVTVTLNGAEVTSYAAPGTYTVTVAMDAAGSGYELGGKVVGTFKVVAGSLADADVVVTDVETGKVVTPNALQVSVSDVAYTYDGTDQSANLAVSVEMDGEELAAGTDYRVVLTTGGPYYVAGGNDRNDAATVVETATNAGTYWLNVIGVNYADWTAVQFTVNQIEIDGLRVQQNEYDVRKGTADAVEVDGKYYVYGIPYTGSEITPVIEYTADEGKTWNVLPTELYRLDGLEIYNVGRDAYVDAESVLSTGKYQVDVLPLAVELAANYKFTEDTENLRFKVIDRVYFQDVLTSEWYAERVHEAWAEGYVNGYADTDLFGPDNYIKRGDVACIMFNVAGKVDQDLDEAHYSSYASFEDVAVGQYWTPAINWAASAKVVNGFADTGLFQPETNITREQFASILANYAKAMKKYTAPTTDISGMPGADGVSDWAAENVEWAVENGVMGRNGADLNAQGYITRAEVAAMVLNFMEKF